MTFRRIRHMFYVKPRVISESVKKINECLKRNAPTLLVLSFKRPICLVNFILFDTQNTRKEMVVLRERFMKSGKCKM